MPASTALAERLNAELTPLPWRERLRALADYPQLRAAFSTSFSLEDQIITHAIAAHALPVRVFTLDTGRLFEETYRTQEATESTYTQLTIETYYPDAKALQQLVAERGINGFYRSVENRLACCDVRKVEPLSRALAGAEFWISGVRREHSETRATLPIAEWDAGRNLIKLYPLADVGLPEIWATIHAEGIPYNPLFERGFPSIGCAPCTRAVEEGEHPRAGRWWWEQEGRKECGLHWQNGKLVRAGDTPHAE